MRALLGLALVGLTAATACGGQRAGAGGRGLTYYESYDPRSLDPALSTDVPTGEMVTLAFDGLPHFDADGRLLPALADRWTAGQDGNGRRYVFHLRPGVKFHDGTPLTAAAVRASLLRVLSPATKGGRPWPLYPIAGAEAYAAGRATDVSGITVLGDSSIAFALTEPLAIFPKFLAMPVASVVPAPPPGDPTQGPVGTGPWRFVAWQRSDYLLFARNPSYWGGAPAGDTLTVRIIPEPLTRAAEFEAGRLSVIEVPFGETARWRAERPGQLVEKPALRVVYVALNNRRGPLRDARVRGAINHAVNRSEILATVYGGRGALAHGALPPGPPGSDPPRRGDRERRPRRQLCVLCRPGHGLADPPRTPHHERHRAYDLVPPDRRARVSRCALAVPLVSHRPVGAAAGARGLGSAGNLQWTTLDARTGRAAGMHLVGRRLLMTLPTLFGVLG